MNKAFLMAAIAVCATALTLSAADPAQPHHKQMTAEQKALVKEMVTKYDTNKDGKLDKAEKAKISQEDKDKMEKAGVTLPGGGKKKA
jgi:hypothetical protein